MKALYATCAVLDVIRCAKLLTAPRNTLNCSKMQRFFSLYGLFPLILGIAFAQQSERIYLRNASFEGEPGHDRTPTGWYSCTLGSTPDIFPGAWGIKHVQPQHGATCLGLTVRDDGTTEDISQALGEKLIAGNCYTFKMWLAHTDSYVGYNRPARIRVWGGTSRGKKECLLDTSPVISGSEWKEYRFQFMAKGDYTHLTLEAWYAPSCGVYRGNILLDNCSPIQRCNRA